MQQYPVIYQCRRAWHPAEIPTAGRRGPRPSRAGPRVGSELAAAPSRRHPHRHAQRGDPPCPTSSRSRPRSATRRRSRPPAAGSACPSPSTAPPSCSRARPPGCSSSCPAGSTRPSCDTATGRVRVRQLRRALGRPGAPRPLPPGVRGGEGPHRGPQAGPLRRRAAPGRRLDQADHHGRRCARERPSRSPSTRRARPRSRPGASPAPSAARPAGSSSRPSARGPPRRSPPSSTRASRPARTCEQST